jgi:chemotaxis signal transduction protein
MANECKYLIFRVGSKPYAIPASLVREIVTALPRFPVPFTPRWVRGVLNRHGEPYVILDVQVLLGGDPLDTRTDVLLALDNDQIAVSISEVLEFRTVAEKDLRTISSPDESTVYFSGALGSASDAVFVLDVPHILERLADDVRNA